MNKRYALPLVIVGLTCLWTPWAPPTAQTQAPPKVQIPKAGVPEIMTMEGKFVRAAYNNEGYVILGYQPANRSIGEEWMLLEVGITVRDGVPGLHVDPRRAVARDAGRQDDSPAVDPGAPRGQHPRAAEAGEGPARLDQLLSAEREPAVRDRLLPRPDLSRAAPRRGRTQQHARLPRPALSSRCLAASSTASTGST